MNTKILINLTKFDLVGITLVGVAKNQAVKVLMPKYCRQVHAPVGQFVDWKDSAAYVHDLQKQASESGIAVVVHWPIPGQGPFRCTEHVVRQASLVIRCTSAGELVVDKCSFGALVDALVAVRSKDV